MLPDLPSRVLNSIGAYIYIYIYIFFFFFFLKYNHTFEFTEYVSMFQTSSSAIVSVTLKFLQDNSYIIYI